MGLLKFVPIKFTFFLIIGILAGHYFNIAILPALTAVILCVIVLGIVLFKVGGISSTSFGVIAYLTVIGIGILSISYAQPEHSVDHYSHQNIQDARTWHLKVREVLKANTFSRKYIVACSSMDTLPISGTLLLTLPRDSTQPSFRVDDELIIYGRPKKIRAPLNPHQFNYAAYMSKQGIYHEMRANFDAIFLKSTSTSTLIGLAAAARKKVRSKLGMAHFGKDELGIIEALLLGQRDNISAVTYTNYKNAGAVHILAVSGLHIGILLGLLQFICKPLERLPKGKSLKLIVIVIVLWAFAFLAGLSPSIVRAVTMFSFLAYAIYLNRPSNTFNILALSMFFILLAIDPMLLFQVGFQMSYSAVIAILWIYPLLQKIGSPKNWALRKIWQLLSVSAAAQLGVLPISLFYFHQFPGLFFISNIIIVPFLGLILSMGILIIVLSVFGMLHPLIVFMYNAIIGYMNTVVSWVAAQEVFIFKNIPFSLGQLLISYVIIICLLQVVSKLNYKRMALLLISIIAFQTWMFHISFHNRQKHEIWVFHQTRSSIVLYRNGHDAITFSSNPKPAYSAITAFEIGEHIASNVHQPLQNSYALEKNRLLIIDRSGIYQSDDLLPNFVLLTQSPKIHLERLLDTLKPTYIIADGSNYRSDVERWAQTCKKRQLPFHYTGDKGAYYFKLDN